MTCWKGHLCPSAHVAYQGQIRRYGSSFSLLPLTRLGKQIQRSHIARAAVAEHIPAVVGAVSLFHQPAGKGLGFYTGEDGYMYVDSMRVEDVRQKVPESPVYLYSKSRMTENFRAYQRALEGLPSLPCYAVKANNNLVIMKHLASLGAGAVLVSGNELKLAIHAGFDPTRWEDVSASR